MKTAILILMLLVASSSHAAVGSKAGLAGKILGLGGKTVQLQVGKKIYVVRRSAFENEDQLRPEAQAIAWLDWAEIEKLQPVPQPQRRM